jgi:hypothetical protein
LLAAQWLGNHSWKLKGGEKECWITPGYIRLAGGGRYIHFNQCLLLFLFLKKIAATNHPIMRMGKVPSSEQTNHPFYSLNEKEKDLMKHSKWQPLWSILSWPGDCFVFHFHRMVFFFYFIFSLSLHRGADDDEKCVCVLALGFVIGRVCYSGAARACRQPTWVAERTALEKTIWCLGGLEEKRKEGTQSHDVYTSTLVWLVFSFFFFFLFLFL